MMAREPLPIKNTLSNLLIFCATVLLFYGLFLGATSVWVGLSHRHQEGFWAPVLAGIFLIALIVWLFARLVLGLTRALRRSDILKP
jgi:hypothetical protein